MRFFLFCMALMLMATPVLADSHRAKVGDTVNNSLEASDQNGTMQSFDALRGEKGATLVFFRSADWCPFCQKQLIELNKDAKKFKEAGYPLIGISYDSVEKLNKFDQKHSPDFTLLSDPASRIIKSFGLMNMEYAKGSFAYGVPHPAIYIVGSDKVIQAVLTEEGYKKRPENADIMAAIEALQPDEPESQEQLEQAP